MKNEMLFGQDRFSSKLSRGVRVELLGDNVSLDDNQLCIHIENPVNELILIMKINTPADRA